MSAFTFFRVDIIMGDMNAHFNGDARLIGVAIV